MERLQSATPAPPVDLSAIAAALADCGAGGGRGVFHADREMFALEQHLQQREQELAIALDRIAGLEAAMQAR